MDFIVMATNNLSLEDGNNVFKGNVEFNDDITLIGDSNIKLDTSIAANQSSGIMLPSIGTGSVTVNKVYYLESNSAWILADANAEGKSTGLLAYANSTGTASSSRMLLQGIVFDSSHGFTVGEPLYLSTTTEGDLTTTVPSGTGDVARIVGYAITADEIYFKPDNTYVVRS